MKYILILLLALSSCQMDVTELQPPVVLISYNPLVVIDGNQKTHALCCYVFAHGRNDKASSAIRANYGIGDTVILPNGQWNSKEWK